MSGTLAIIALLVISGAGVLGGASFVLPLLALLLILAGYGVRSIALRSRVDRQARQERSAVMFQ